MRIGIDLGGTKIEIVAIGDRGEERYRRRISAPRDSYPATVDAIVGLVVEAEAHVGRASVGIGMPGVISPATGLVKNANSTWLNGHPLQKDLIARLGRPVRLANDANCFALSEATDGAGAGRLTVFGVIIGTGTGGGIVVAGNVLTGANAIAGEWGHNPLPWPDTSEWPGPSCYCGRTGCIETFLSGPGFQRDHESTTGMRLAPEAIVQRAAERNADALATIDRYVQRMARALASVINVLDPDAIVLGGGMSKLPGLTTRVPECWQQFVFSDRVDTPLVLAAHGDASGVRGAAWL